jgi:hypothetical protein
MLPSLLLRVATSDYNPRTQSNGRLAPPGPMTRRFNRIFDAGSQVAWGTIAWQALPLTRPAW